MEREPGWYPHPRYPEDELWWDGTQWGPARPGGHRRKQPAAPPDPAKQRSLTVIVLFLVGMTVVYFALWFLVAHTSDSQMPFGPGAASPVVAPGPAPYG